MSQSLLSSSQLPYVTCICKEEWCDNDDEMIPMFVKDKIYKVYIDENLRNGRNYISKTEDNWMMDFNKKEFERIFIDLSERRDNIIESVLS